MGLEEYHIEQTTETPLPVMEVERQEIENLVEEYEDVFPGIRKLKGVTIKLHEATNAPGAVQSKGGYLYP